MRGIAPTFIKPAFLVATLISGATLTMAVTPAWSSAPTSTAGSNISKANAESTTIQSDLPKSVSLRPQFKQFGLEVRRQGNRGTCSVFAVTGALEFAAAKKQGRGRQLSVEFLNWAAHTAVHRSEDGGFFSDLWKGFETYGLCTEKDLPYQQEFDASLQPAESVRKEALEMLQLGLKLHWIKEWDVHTGLESTQLQEIKRTLVNGWPVCGGFRWPKQTRWDGDVLRMCPAEDVFDGHSVLLVGYQDDTTLPGGGVFFIRNSGGDGPDGSMSYEYVSAYMNDAAWISSQ